MNPDHVEVQVRERSGLDVQAVTLVRSGSDEAEMPSVWAAMTEVGHFWAVEDGQHLELFRAVARRTAPDDLLSCHSAIEAARRFLVLHPPPVRQVAGRMPVRAAPRTNESSESSAAIGVESSDSSVCQTCGVSYMHRRQTVHSQTTTSARALCPRCRHAERERKRYQQDPSYRARRLAYSAERYRRSQQSADGES